MCLIRTGSKPKLWLSDADHDAWIDGAAEPRPRDRLDPLIVIRTTQLRSGWFGCGSFTLAWCDGLIRVDPVLPSPLVRSFVT